MPKLEVSREELEILIDAVMMHRIDTPPTCVGGLDYIKKVADLHVKLEEALELWIHGGVVEVPIPDYLKDIKGISSMEIEHPPHDGGL